MTFEGLRQRLRQVRGGEDDGFTLVEMLISLVLFSIVMAAVMTTVITVNRSSKDTQQTVDANEESRLAISRITRDLREATDITNVSSPDGATSMTLVDSFLDTSGNSVTTQSTYTWNSATGQIILTGTDEAGNSSTQPILAANVSDFHIYYYSSLYQCDTNANGTDWTELDKAPVSGLNGCNASWGNNNGVLDQELTHIDRVRIVITVLEGSHKQTYDTSVDLRNHQMS